MLTLAAMLAAASFSVSDTTDNNTGEREVYALQIAKDRESLGFIYLRCDAGTPRFMLELYEAPKTEWVIVTTDGTGDDPLNFRMSTDIYRNLVFQGDSAGLVEKLQGVRSVSLTAHYQFRKLTYNFDTDGIASSWERVVKHCPAPDV